MPNAQEIQRLRNRYELRDEGAYMRDLCEIVGEDTSRILAAASSKFKGPDRLYFRQGFLFRCWELNCRTGG